MYAKYSEKLTFLTPWHAHVRVRVSFSGNFAYVLSEWSQLRLQIFCPTFPGEGQTLLCIAISTDNILLGKADLDLTNFSLDKNTTLDQ